MTLIEQISKDFMTAYKAKELTKKDFLGVLKTEVTKESKTPEDTYVVGKIKSMIKNAAASDSLSESELLTLNTYLPSQMTEDELVLVINAEVKYNGYSGMKDMGKVMSFLKSNYEGMYDGHLASSIIRNILN